LKRIEKEQDTITNICKDSSLVDSRISANNNRIINSSKTVAAEAASAATILLP
jgi:hypothetical protein